MSYIQPSAIASDEHVSRSSRSAKRSPEKADVDMEGENEVEDEDELVDEDEDFEEDDQANGSVSYVLQVFGSTS
jgi:hypothetical protein